MEKPMEQINNITKERKWKQITERDRYKIEALLASGMRSSDIARQIGCSKRTDFSKIKKNELRRIEDWVNNYPRKIFKFKSANEMYCEAI